MIRQFRVADWHYQIIYPDGYPCADLFLDSSLPFEEKPTDSGILFRICIDDSFRPADSGNLVVQEDDPASHCGILLNAHGDYTFRIANPADQQCGLAQTDARFTHMNLALRGNDLTRFLGFNNAMMMMYSFATADKGTLLVHASAVRRQGTAYLFLGESGTGKSTHTANWQRFLGGCDLINDDNPVVRTINGHTHVYGSPWSGKTPCYRQTEAPVGAFVQLEQAPHNAIHRYPPLDAYAALISSGSVMKWDRRIYGGINDTIEQILAQTPVYHLENLPDEAAVRLCHDTIATATNDE